MPSKLYIINRKPGEEPFITRPIVNSREAACIAVKDAKIRFPGVESIVAEVTEGGELYVVSASLFVENSKSKANGESA